MKQIILSIGLLLAGVCSIKAQVVRVVNSTNCPVDVRVNEYDGSCTLVNSSAVTTVSFSPVDFTMTPGNSYGVEVTSLWLSGTAIPTVGVGCGLGPAQGPVTERICTGVNGDAYSEVIPGPYPPGIDMIVDIHL